MDDINQPIELKILIELFHWNNSVALNGLSMEHKILCTDAFNETLDFIHKNPDDLCLVIGKENIDIFKKKYISIRHIKNYLKYLFDVDKRIHLNFIIFPMIRRIIEAGKNFELFDFLKHCKNKIKSFDISSLPDNADIESEICIYLSTTYNGK